MQQEQGQTVFAFVYLLPTDRQIDLLSSPELSQESLAILFGTSARLVEGPFAFRLEGKILHAIDVVGWVVQTDLRRAYNHHVVLALAASFNVPEDHIGIAWWSPHNSKSRRAVSHFGPAKRAAVRLALRALFDQLALRRPIPAPDFDDPPDEDDDDDLPEPPETPKLRRK